MQNLSFQAEEFITKRVRVTPCTLAKELQCVTAELKVELSKIVSQLILKHNWRIEHVGSRLFIVAESAVDKTRKITHTKHAEGTIQVKPKCLPVEGDWIVTCKTTPGRLYFDSSYSRDECRSSFAKSEKAKRENTLICRYHKTETFRPIHGIIANTEMI